MVIVVTRFDLGKHGFDKNINEITSNDILMVPNIGIHRADAILFHDTSRTGNWKVLKCRGDVKYRNMVINKYNKGLLIDLLTHYHD